MREEEARGNGMGRHNDKKKLVLVFTCFVLFASLVYKLAQVKKVDTSEQEKHHFWSTGSVTIRLCFSSATSLLS